MVSILHGYYPLRHVTVAHIFSYKRDQSTSNLRSSTYLNCGILSNDGLKWGDLDNRKLKFKESARPTARYLNFYYCPQVLRWALKIGPREKAAIALYDEFGKPVWATAYPRQIYWKEDA